jgi:peptide/nickel transport system ATP-binding protein
MERGGRAGGALLGPAAGAGAMTELLRVARVDKTFVAPPRFGDGLLRLIGRAPRRAVLRAVSDVSLDMTRGEALGLVGASGCGKSTLGRVIAGVHPQSAGQVLLGGAPVTNAAGAKTTTRVQMVFQDPFASLDPRMRVGDSLAEGPLAHGLTTRAGVRDYVGGWLDAVNLPREAAGRYPHQFSGGQRQRIAIARALAMQPELIVCDEPVASLDVSIQAQIINLFLDLRRRLGLTMIFISHDLSVVRHVCDRIAIMYLGRIVELGAGADIFARPRHPYTRALIDSAPRLALDDATAVFQPIEGELPSPLNPPSGCAFHQRCPRAQARCRIERPEMRTIEAGREVACHDPL